MQFEEQVKFQCPYCLQPISMVIEPLEGSQKYTEDCEVCCQPIEIRFSVNDGEIQSFEAERADG